jgi:hypothetical protein
MDMVRLYQLHALRVVTTDRLSRAMHARSRETLKATIIPLPCASTKVRATRGGPSAEGTLALNACRIVVAAKTMKERKLM